MSPCAEAASPSGSSLLRRATLRSRRAEQRQRQQRDPQSPGKREDREDRGPEQTIADRAVEAALDLAARRFDERRVLHAGRTGGHAGHAAETRVEVPTNERHHRRAPFEGRLSSGRSAREANPFPRPTARRSDTSGGRSRSARTRRSARSMGGSSPSNAADALISAPGRRSECPADRARASATRTAADALPWLPQTSTSDLSSGEPRRSTTLPNDADRRSWSMARACAFAWPSMRIRPDPTAARPSISVSTTPLVAAARLQLADRGRQVGRQPARADHRPRRRPRAAFVVLGSRVHAPRSPSTRSSLAPISSARHEPAPRRRPAPTRIGAAAQTSARGSRRRSARAGSPSPRARRQ